MTHSLHGVELEFPTWSQKQALLNDCYRGCLAPRDLFNSMKDVLEKMVKSKKVDFDARTRDCTYEGRSYSRNSMARWVMEFYAYDDPQFPTVVRIRRIGDDDGFCFADVINDMVELCIEKKMFHQEKAEQMLFEAYSDEDDSMSIDLDMESLDFKEDIDAPIESEKERGEELKEHSLLVYKNFVEYQIKDHYVDETSVFCATQLQDYCENDADIRKYLVECHPTILNDLREKLMCKPYNALYVTSVVATIAAIWTTSSEYRMLEKLADPNFLDETYERWANTFTYKPEKAIMEIRCTKSQQVVEHIKTLKSSMGIKDTLPGILPEVSSP